MAITATVTLTITMGQTTYGVTDTISVGDLNRLIAAYQSTFGTTDNVSTGLAWAAQLVSVTKQTVHAYEETLAVSQARAAVTDIGIG